MEFCAKRGGACPVAENFYNLEQTRVCIRTPAHLFSLPNWEAQQALSSHVEASGLAVLHVP